MSKWLQRSTVIVLLLFTTAKGQLVVNEVMSNAPGQVENLEWIELYHDWNSSEDLSFYSMDYVTPTGTTQVPLAGTIPARSYYVLCKSLVRFEQAYGDNSGIWGDSIPLESYTVVQVPTLTLRNEGATLILYRLTTELSRFEWSTEGDDGVSWERTEFVSDSIAPSIDPSGSTPGRLNSLTKLPEDLSLDDVESTILNGLTTIAFSVTNVGTDSVYNATLQLFLADSLQPGGTGQLIDAQPVGPLFPEFTTVLLGQYHFGGLYQDLVAILSDDDRPANNRREFKAPGNQFPPLQLSEFLANPPPGGSEWIELKNISFDPVNLFGWNYADSIGTATLINQSISVPPGGYVVFTEDSTGFKFQYPDRPDLLIQATQWRTLNNGGDIIILSDRYGIEADWFVYSTVYPDSHTWSRAETGDHAGEWGRSDDVGGTPGEPNLVRFGAEFGNSISLSIEPRIISPDGNGVDDSAVIKVVAPEASGFTLKIYDSQGRPVVTLEDNAQDLKDEYVWNGRSGSGERLAIGIYVVFFEAEGVESAKKTVVLAR